MRIVRRVVMWGIAAVVLLAALGWLLLSWPQPWFRWSARLENLTLYSDEAFDADAAIRVLERTRTNLSGSPFFAPAARHAVFVCNTYWRHRLFMAPSLNAGGVNYFPATTNVFLSGAEVAANRLVSPSRKPDVFGRTLDHFIAHEITHTLEVRAVGVIAYRRMPDWVKEGYAEYIGSGRRLDYAAAARAFLANAPVMNYPAAAPYLRYRLMVTHLIEKRGWEHRRLLGTTMSREEAERLIAHDLAEAHLSPASEQPLVPGTAPAEVLPSRPPTR